MSSRQRRLLFRIQPSAFILICVRPHHAALAAIEIARSRIVHLPLAIGHLHVDQRVARSARSSHRLGVAGQDRRRFPGVADRRRRGGKVIGQAIAIRVEPAAGEALGHVAGIRPVVGHVRGNRLRSRSGRSVLRLELRECQRDLPGRSFVIQFRRFSQRLMQQLLMPHRQLERFLQHRNRALLGLERLHRRRAVRVVRFVALIRAVSIAGCALAAVAGIGCVPGIRGRIARGGRRVRRGLGLVFGQRDAQGLRLLGFTGDLVEDVLKSLPAVVRRLLRASSAAGRLASRSHWLPSRDRSR